MMTLKLEEAQIFFDNLTGLSCQKHRVAAVIRGSDGKPFTTGYSDLQIKDAYDITHTVRTRLEKDGPFRSEESHIYYERCNQVLDVASPYFNKSIEIDLYSVDDVGKPGATPIRTMRLFQSPVMRKKF